MLSQYYEERYALELIGERAEGVGYLLKERVGDVDAFIDAVKRVAAGGTCSAPRSSERMLGRRARNRPIDQLARASATCSPRWPRASPTGDRRGAVRDQAAVEKHVTSIFQKLELNRRPTTTAACSRC